MAERSISFQFQHPTFRLRHIRAIRQWLHDCAAQEGHSIAALHYMFCTDEHMLQANRQFLDHDYLTDILTFPTPSSSGLAADILISIDRVRENARTHHTAPQEETLRVMAHGALHLIGFDDRDEPARTTMRNKENQWLSAWRQPL